MQNQSWYLRLQLFLLLLITLSEHYWYILFFFWLVRQRLALSFVRLGKILKKLLHSLFSYSLQVYILKNVFAQRNTFIYICHITRKDSKKLLQSLFSLEVNILKNVRAHRNTFIYICHITWRDPEKSMHQRRLTSQHPEKLSRAWTLVVLSQQTHQ